VNSELERVLDQLPKDFFGTVEISFQNGRPHIAKVTQTHKLFNTTPTDRRENRGSNNGDTERFSR
jgi:hypothetical protein